MTGLMGCPGLCNLINPMEGAEGFRLMYLYLLPLGIGVLLSFIVLLISFWTVLVGSVVEAMKLFP